MKHARPQQGFVLVTALVFLIVLSTLGVMALRGSLFEERMASNDRDREMAREYAEMALRDAERDILGQRFDGKFCATLCAHTRPAGSRPATLGDVKNFWNLDAATNVDTIFEDGGLSAAANAKGMYNPDAAAACGKPVWSGADWNDGAVPARSCDGTIGAAVPTIPYGFFTDAPFLGPDGVNPPQGVIPPRYLIEVFPGKSVTYESRKVFFRITAVGFGRTSGPTGRTSVTLQSVFSPS